MFMQIPLVSFVRRGALVLAAVVLLAVGVLVLNAPSGAGARPVAHLTLVKGNPVTVSGRGFRPRVRVHLMLVNKATITRRPLASRTGTFTVTFPTTLDRCSGWSVTANQPGRALVTLRSPARPECPPL
jgi:hypothetical protein